MLDTRPAARLNPEPGSSAPLCFLIDEDFAFRQDFAKELRRSGIDVVEFSNSYRFIDTIENQRPDTAFINVSSAAAHECVRALFALKECRYGGAVQLFGNCDLKMLDSFNTVGRDWSLSMLPPMTKPLKIAAVRRIILDRKPGAGATAAASLDVSLGDALAKNLVKFLYHPKFDLKTNLMLGVEVLARVAHPEFGLIAPDLFLSGADEDDLLNLARLALVRALKASAHFLELGIALEAAINIGADELLRLPICDLVMMHRPERGDWPGLILEVPERQVINKIDHLKARAPSLRQAGVSIAIDNVGRGSSRLGILNQLPFSELKIDPSLVKGGAASGGNANMCKTIIQMAHNFGGRATAVGISTEADLRTLSGSDCDFGQGFLFGKPMTIEQIDGLIANFKGQAGESSSTGQ